MAVAVAAGERRFEHRLRARHHQNVVLDGELGAVVVLVELGAVLVAVLLRALLLHERDQLVLVLRLQGADELVVLAPVGDALGVDAAHHERGCRGSA